MNPNKERIYIFVNGIMTWPGSTKSWNANAVTHCMCYRRIFAEKLEYFTLPTISRIIGQKDRAEKLRKRIQRYIHNGWEIVLVGHSNGCDVILDTLESMAWPRVEEIHLISAACEENFEENGLNEALRRKWVGRVFIYQALQDKPLRLAATLFGKIFGYGKLGIATRDQMNLCDDIEDRDQRVTVVQEETFGHSTWFKEAHFIDTMRLILRDPISGDTTYN